MHLALVAGDGEHLWPPTRWRRLVAGDVASLGSNDALVGRKQHVDHRRVGLRAAHQKKNYVGIGGLTGLTDKLLGTLGVRIGTVAGLRLHIGVDERLQHCRMCAVGIIVVKRGAWQSSLTGYRPDDSNGAIVRRWDRQCARQGTQVPVRGKTAAHVTQKCAPITMRPKATSAAITAAAQKITRLATVFP